MIIFIRKGMINVSPIGRACSQTERDSFEQHDKTANVRPKMVEHLKVSPTNIFSIPDDDRMIGLFLFKARLDTGGHLPVLQ